MASFTLDGHGQGGTRSLCGLGHARRGRAPASDPRSCSTLAARRPDAGARAAAGPPAARRPGPPRGSRQGWRRPCRPRAITSRTSRRGRRATRRRGRPGPRHGWRRRSARAGPAAGRAGRASAEQRADLADRALVVARHASASASVATSAHQPVATKSPTADEGVAGAEVGRRAALGQPRLTVDGPVRQAAVARARPARRPRREDLAPARGSSSRSGLTRSSSA